MSLNLPRSSRGEPSSLEGQLLIAMPMVVGEPFARSLIFVCAHSAEGAMGIVLNRPATSMKLPDLLVQLDILAESDRGNLPDSAVQMPILMGGPVETSRGFVLHSSDYHIPQSTLPIDDGICLTATVDILRAIARGEGPESAILALGYAGWQPGQLEGEIQANGWLTCPANADLIFNAPVETRYELAMQFIGVKPAMLSGEVGHA